MLKYESTAKEMLGANFSFCCARFDDVNITWCHLAHSLLCLQAAINRVMPQDASSSSAQHDHDNDTHDVEMIDDDISVITPKTHPPGMISIIILFAYYDKSLYIVNVLTFSLQPKGNLNFTFLIFSQACYTYGEWTEHFLSKNELNVSKYPSPPLSHFATAK